MKILYAKNSFAGPISGADEIAVTYAIELKAAGHETSMLLVQPPHESESLVARLKAADVPFHTLASPKFSSSLAVGKRILIRAMRTFSPARNLILSKSRKVVFSLLQQYHDACCEYLRKVKPDLIHVLTPDPGAVMLVRAAHHTGIPVIYQEVGIPFHPPGFEEVYERFVSVMPMCAEVAALSPALVEKLTSVVPHLDSAKVLPLISLDHNHSAPTKDSNRPVTFGFSARLEHLKGPMRLLEAFRMAQQSHPEMELRIAGDGSQRQEFIDKSRADGLENKCHLLGIYKTLQERAEFMDSYDVFVLPSLTEGTPNVIIEAMAHGKPTIATAVGGVPDLITEDVGILVPMDDQQAMAGAMVRLASDAELRTRMGIAARKRYEQLFTPQAVLPVLVDFYQAVIAKHRAASNGKASVATHEWATKMTQAT